MLDRAKTLIAVALIGAAFVAGWLVNGWRLTSQHAQELAQRDKEALAMAEASKQIGIEANKAISAAATKAWKGMEDERKELNRLRGCVADRTCGVRLIPASGSGFDSTASAGGLGNDTIDLSADLQRRILDLRESIGQDAAKIEYLQSYALQCLKAAAR